MQAVRRVLLSSEALCLSLGQFLELSFGTPHLRVHGRSLHGGFVRYFGTGVLWFPLLLVCMCLSGSTVSAGVALITYIHPGPSTWMQWLRELL